MYGELATMLASDNGFNSEGISKAQRQLSHSHHTSRRPINARDVTVIRTAHVRNCKPSRAEFDF